MGKDGVPGEADAPQHLTLPDLIAKFDGDAAGLHVYKQAVLAIPVIEQNKITDVFGILAGRKFRIADARGFRVFKPVFRDVVGGCDDNAASGRIDRRPVTVPILERTRIVVIGLALSVHIDEVAGEIIGVCGNA